MCVENHRVASRDNVYNVTAQGRNGMSAGSNCAYYTKWREFLERNSMVTAASQGSQPIHAWHELNNLQLLDLVIQPANLRFLELNAAPFFRILVGKSLNDLLNLSSCTHALFTKLFERFL